MTERENEEAERKRIQAHFRDLASSENSPFMKPEEVASMLPPWLTERYTYRWHPKDWLLTEEQKKALLLKADCCSCGAAVEHETMRQIGEAEPICPNCYRSRIVNKITKDCR